MAHQKILILDFGGQYTQLIARRVREAKVYCEIHPHDVSDAFVREYGAQGINRRGSRRFPADEPVLECGLAPPVPTAHGSGAGGISSAGRPAVVLSLLRKAWTFRRKAA